MIILYNHNLSVCVQKVRLALSEKGIDWVDRNVDLMKGEQLDPEYLKLNPKGIVPTLVHDENIVVESTVILEYLEDVFPSPSLMPPTAMERARMRVWTKTPDDGLHIACATISYAAAFGEQVVRFHGAQAVEERIAKIPDHDRAFRQRVLYEQRMEAPFLSDHVLLHRTVLKRMAGRLDNCDWLAGQDYSLAECALLPYVWRLERLGLCRMWDDFPSVSRWFETCKKRPSWTRAMESYPPLGDHDYDDDLVSKGIDIWPKIGRLIHA